MEEALLAGKEFIPDPGLPAVLAQLKNAMSGEQAYFHSKKEHLPSVSKQNQNTYKDLTEDYPAEDEMADIQSGS